MIDNIKIRLHELIRKRKFKQARNIYLKNRDRQIPDIDLWNMFAGVNYELKHFGDTVHCCQRALDIDPDHFQTLYSIATVYKIMGEHEKSIEYYNRCISVNPSYTNSYTELGDIYKIVGDFERSVDMYEKALSTDKRNSAIMAELGMSLARSNRVNEALECINKALDIDGRNEKALFYAGQITHENKLYARAIEYYSKLRNLNDKDATILNNLGRSYEESGDVEKAIRCYEDALELSPGNFIIYKNMGKAYLSISRLDESMAAITRAIEIDSSDPECYYCLGRIYSESGRVDDAIECFNRALSMPADDSFENHEEFITATKYHLSSLLDPETFDEDKKRFISTFFDDYSERFTRHLMDDLKYRIPDGVKHAMEKHTESGRKYRIIDLGCGTGICSSFLRDHSSKLTGIDISPRMIEQCRSLGTYDELIIGEISEALCDSEGTYDIAIATDVFIYIGGLKTFFQRCHDTLSDGGLFIFSIELLQDSDRDFILQEHGRYKHSIGYIDKLADTYNFDLVSHIESDVRMHHGCQVPGMITVLRKTTTSRAPSNT